MRHTFQVLVLALGSVMASGFVSANLDRPPMGSSGAPGEGTCGAAGCHDTPSNAIGTFYLDLLSPQANDTLQFRILLADDGAGPAVDDFGFQLTVSDSMGQPYGELVVTDSVRTQLAEDSVGRQYLSHTAAGTVDGSCIFCNQWEFRWARPFGSVSSDLIRFNVAGVLANADGTPAGDAVAVDSFGGVNCPVVITGDANESGTITSADVIALIGTLFKGGNRISPCLAAGDVNCSGRFTAADAVTLINYVFKAGPPPCDVCPLILSGVWICY